MKILAFSGSNSSKSINQKLIRYVASIIKGHEVTVIDIRDYALPIYSQDMDEEPRPHNLLKFIAEIKKYDAYIISSPEHNSGPPAVFKNLYDWITRTERDVFADKPMLVMATSPGARGGKTVIEYLETLFKRKGINVVSTFSLPSFEENFVVGKLNSEYRETLQSAIQALFNR